MFFSSLKEALNSPIFSGWSIAFDGPFGLIVYMGTIKGFYLALYSIMILIP